MIIYNQDQIRPPEELLEQSFKVPFTMTANNFLIKPKLLRDWAREHCVSFIWWELNQPKTIYYYFAEEQDATAFRLKWL